MPPKPSTQVIFGLFVDICESTSLHNDDRLGRDEPSRAKQFLEAIKNPFDRVVAEVIREAEGWLVNPAGDGWCCALYDPQKAVLAALFLQERLKQALEDTPVGQVYARIGLSSAVIGSTAVSYIHQAGNLAARVQAFAPPGGVAVTASVYAQCQGRLTGVRWVDKGFKRFKGETDPQQVHWVECSPEVLEPLKSVWDKAVQNAPVVIEVGLGLENGRYLLNEQVSSGGQGEVWRARQTDGLGVSTKVAIKFLRPDMLERPQDRDQLLTWFHEEVETVSQLRHPHIAGYLGADYWLPPGSNLAIPYLVLSWIEGKPLDVAVRENGGAYPVRTVVGVMIEVCRAVQYLHALRCLHLDLKPNNILVQVLGDRLHPVLLDFGISQKYAPSRPIDFSRLGQGTAAYQAPEQLDPSGNGPTPQTDVHALGVILFELLTNQSPHGRGTADELRDRICGGPRVKLQEADPNRDRELGEIVDRAIAIKPNDRFESANALGEALSKWREKTSVASPNRPQQNNDSCHRGPGRDDLLEPYFKWLAHRCADLQFPGLPEEWASKIQLAEVYSELHVIDWNKDEKELDLERRMYSPEAQRVPVIQKVLDPSISRLVLLGPPGAGKSTFLRYLAFCLSCQRCQPAANEFGESAKKATGYLKGLLSPQEQDTLYSKLPVWVELRELVKTWQKAPDLEYATPGWLIDEYLKSVAKEIRGTSGSSLPDESDKFIRQAISENKALFLLDGWDEITVEEDRNFIRTVLCGFIRGSLKRSQMILTCRVRTWDGAWQIPSWGTPFILTGFDYDDRTKFLKQWFSHREILGLTSQVEADKKHSELEVFIEKSPANRRDKLVEMARIPLLLTMMAWLKIRIVNLPEDRAALYEKFILTLLWDLDGKRGIPSLTQVVESAGVPQDHFFAVLSEVAFKAQQETPKEGLHNIRTGDWVKAFVQLKPLKEKNSPGSHRDPMSDRDAENWVRTKVLDQLQFRSGLVRDEGTGEYRFQHRSFQEYLAAAHLTLSPEGAAQAILWKEKALKAESEGEVASLRESLWEVFRLAAGRLAHLEDKPTPWLRGVDTAFPLVVALSQVLVRPGKWPWHELWLSAELLDELGLIVPSKNPWEGRQPMRTPWEDLARRIASRLARLVRTGALTARERDAVGKLLGRLGDPRPGVGILRGSASSPGIPDFVWCGAGGEVRGTGPEIGIKAFPKVNSFPMGEPSSRPDSQRAFSSFEQFPCRRLTEPFLIAKFPVTVAQYQVFVQAGGYGSATAPKPAWWTNPGWEWRVANKVEGPEACGEEFRVANHPQVGVSWYESLAYVRWLNRPESGISFGLPEGWQIALPTEAQWELAARWNSELDAVDDRLYPWGGEGQDSETEISEHCNWRKTGLDHTNAVGLLPKGKAACGALDLSGNVWEWCLTKWVYSADNYNDPGNGIEDDNGKDARVVRGGSWVSDVPRVLRSCVRVSFGPDARYNFIGFRVVLVGKFL